MNIILFEDAEITRPLPLSDPRAGHILTVLKRSSGERFDAGVVDGPIGKGWIESQSAEALFLGFAWTGPTPPLSPIHLLVGLPRPQTARKILQEATSLGVASITFFQSEKGEPSYASSTLWSTDEWRRLLVAGATQAFDTRIPVIVHHAFLVDALSAVPTGAPVVALDNYEASGPYSAAVATSGTCVVAVGPERGWSAAERIHLRDKGASLAHLGSRVLRVETALLSAVAILKAARREM